MLLSLSNAMRSKSGGARAGAAPHTPTQPTGGASSVSSSNVVSETPEGAAPPASSSLGAGGKSSTAKKQRSIHDFFGSGRAPARGSNDGSSGNGTRKKRSLASAVSLDNEPVKKRIDYDDSDSEEEDEEEASSMLSQSSDGLRTPAPGVRTRPSVGNAAGASAGSTSSSTISVVKPKRIDFGGICPSSQRSEPDLEPANADSLGSSGPVEPFTFSRQASQPFYGGYGGGMFSQDDMDFCTPADQPVMPLSHPTTPSPMKKRQRRAQLDDILGANNSHTRSHNSHGAELVEEEEVQNLTQDMTHMDVAKAAAAASRASAATALPSFSSSDSSDMMLATPQRVLGMPTAFLPGGRRRHEQRDANLKAPPSLSGSTAVQVPAIASSTAAAPGVEAFTNPFAPVPEVDSRKRRPARRLRQSFPPAFGGHSISVPYSRYLSEFVEQEVIGSGAFSKVFKCMKKIDGWTYAIKKSKRHLRGRADTERALREVQALAALSDSRHIVRYFDAWIEDDLLYIQLEHCTGCSLATLVDQYKPLHVPEETLCKVLCHLAQGLHDMHAKHMVHMDVKLQNVLVASGEIYKLGDLGTVALLDGSMDITEGDNRYLSRELLEGSRSNLRAGDIFALGATIYELALGATLPNGGEEWQKIRDGDLTLFRQYTNSLQHLIASMMHPDPLQRPAAEEILQHEVVLPYRQRH